MQNPPPIAQISERVDRLLLRYAELQRTNALLVRQMDALTQERDALKARLDAVRNRVDGLIDRLPESRLLPKESP